WAQSCERFCSASTEETCSTCGVLGTPRKRRRPRFKSTLPESGRLSASTWRGREAPWTPRRYGASWIGGCRRESFCPTWRDSCQVAQPTPLGRLATCSARYFYLIWMPWHEHVVQPAG